jgi:hypothetical protein
VSAEDDFAIVDGQSFVYDVITSKIDVSVSRLDLLVDAFQFGEHQFSSNNSVEITVTSVKWNSLNYSITCDNITYNTTYYDQENSRTYYFHRFIGNSPTISLIFQETYADYGILTPCYYSNGIPLDHETRFFIPHEESTWEHLQEISNQLNIDPYLEYTPTTDAFSNLILNSSYAEQNGLAILENYIQASIEYSSAKGKISNGSKFVYNMTNGVLYGYRSKAYFDGEIKGDKVHLESEFHIEIAGYNLTDFTFYTELSPSNVKIIGYIFIGVFAVGVTIPIVVISIRKKRHQ